MKQVFDTLVLATHNKGKIAEFTAMLAPYVPNILMADGLNLPEPEETGETFEANALLKAEASAKVCGYAVLSDDSGLCVEALDGAPGVYSARWAGESKDFNAAMQRIEEKLAGNTNRRAAFVSVLVLAHPDGTYLTARGEVQGTLVWPPRGEGGFGYDPMFVPDGDTRTFGEMTRAEKAQFSHRAKALAALKEQAF